MKVTSQIYSLTLSTLILQPSTFAFQTSANVGLSGHEVGRNSQSSSSLALFQDFSDDEDTFRFSQSDRERIKALYDRKITMPILIISTAILPEQSMEVTSGDPKFKNLIDYILNKSEHNEIGIIGLNPYDNSPLNIGVTAEITPKNVKQRHILGTSLHITGKRRFEVEEEPQLDESGSFYTASVDIVEDREEIMSKEQKQEAEKLSNKLPSLLKKWKELVYSTGLKREVKSLMESIGPMPSNIGKRALWVGSLVNPLPELKLCSEIRPAILACKNDHQRIHLAVLSLQSSIDFLSSGRKTS